MKNLSEMIEFCEDIKMDITDVIDKGTDGLRTLFDDYKESLDKRDFAFASFVMSSAMYFINEEDFFYYYMTNDKPTRFLSVNESDLIVPTDNNEPIVQVVWEIPLALIHRFMDVENLLK